MSMPERLISQSDAINEALDQCMAENSKVIVIGEGVPDPKTIFGTTRNLHEKYGAQRVFDMPLAENGMTGIAIGAAITGLRPVMVHQRIDFALLSMDQLVNNAAKWRFMFAGQAKVPLVVRLIIGRGWGQGAQHAQALHALFAHIPGLRVVMPATANDAKGMMVAAIRSDDPVIFIEHRWLHGVVDKVPEPIYPLPLEGAACRRPGTDITIAACSWMVIDALLAAEALEKLGISAEVIDLRVVRPVDTATVAASVRKTGLLAIADVGHITAGISAEVSAGVCEATWDSLKKAPKRIGLPNVPAPTSHFLAGDYYPGPLTLAQACADLVGRKDAESLLAKLLPPPPRSDIPHACFRGPF